MMIYVGSLEHGFYWLSIWKLGMSCHPNWLLDFSEGLVAQPPTTDQEVWLESMEMSLW
jgi:hypothetical protein